MKSPAEINMDPQQAYALGANYFHGVGVPKDFKKAVEYFQVAANKGHALAQCNLGYCYANGFGIIKDNKKAFEFYQSAAVQGEALAQYNLGRCYLEGCGVTQDLKKAIDFLQSSVNKGNAYAQGCLGSCYRDGIGVEKDLKKAIELYQLSVKQNNVLGQVYLGYCYQTGTGVSQDLKKAIELFQPAVNQDFWLAQMYLGICYRDGTGVAKDSKKAIELFKLSAKQNDPRVLLLLANCYQNGIGDVKDSKKAIELYQLAADQGYATAQYLLGSIYKLGVGVEKNDNKGKDLIRLAAAQNYLPALSDLAHDYEREYELRNHFNPSPNPDPLVRELLKKAFEHYELAAKLGDSASQYYLAEYYEEGKAIEIDHKKAIENYQLAANQMHYLAEYKLGICYRDGIGVAQDFKRAMEFFQLAAKHGYSEAQYQLGRHYEEGIIVEKDFKKAAEFYQLAATHHSEAKYELGMCYLNGKGLVKDAEKAVEIFKSLTNPLLNRTALYSLGYCYANGLGVTKDEKRAIELYEQATNYGCSKAQYHLAQLYESGIGVLKDEKRAADLYCLAAYQGHANAQYRFGLCCDNGIGVEKNAKRAAEFYQKAADQGNNKAQRVLGIHFENGIDISKMVKKVNEFCKFAHDQVILAANFNINTINASRRVDLSSTIELAYKAGFKVQSSDSNSVVELMSFIVDRIDSAKKRVNHAPAQNRASQPKYHLVFTHHHPQLKKQISISKIITDSTTLDLPGYKARVIVDAHGAFSIQDLETRADIHLLLPTKGQASRIKTQGKLYIHCRDNFDILGTVEANEVFCISNLLKNRSNIIANKLKIYTFSKFSIQDHPIPKQASTVTFDNRGGKIFVCNKLRIKGGTLDNRAGLIYTLNTKMRAHGDFHNEGGEILCLGKSSFIANNIIYNSNGSILANAPLIIGSRQAFIHNRNQGIIASTQDLKAYAFRILLDESSLLRGEENTQISAEIFRQDAPIRARDVLLDIQKHLNSNAVIISERKGKLQQAGTKRLHLKYLCGVGEFNITANRLSYMPDSFKMAGNLNLFLRESQDILTPIHNLGNIQVTFQKQASRPIQIAADITTCSPRKKLGDITVRSESQNLTFGSAQKPITVQANGKLILDAPNLNLIQGSLRSGQEIRLIADKVKLGILPLPKQLPSSILSGGKLNIEAKEKCEMEGLQLYSQTKFKVRSKEIDSLSCSLTAKEDAEFDTPSLTIRQNHNGTNVTSSPSKMNITHDLITTGKTVVRGAAELSYKEHLGSKVQSEPLCDYITVQVLAGHYRHKPFLENYIYTPYYHDERRVSKTHSLTISNSGKLESEASELIICHQLSALSVSFKNFAVCKIGTGPTALYVPTPTPFKSRHSLFSNIDIDPMFQPNPLAFSNTIRLVSIMQPVIPLPMSNPDDYKDIYILNKDGFLEPNNNRFIILPHLVQEEKRLNEKLMQTIKRSFINDKVRTPEEVLRYLKQNARRVFESGCSMHNISEYITEPLLFYTTAQYISSGHECTILMPEIELPKCYDNTRQTSASAYLLALYGAEFLGLPDSTLDITGVVQVPQGKFKVSNVRHMSVVKPVHRETVLVENEYQKDNLIWTSTKKELHTLTKETPVPGGEVDAQFVDIQTEELNTKGAQFKTKQDMIINAKNSVDTSLIQSHIKTAYSESGNDWISSSSHEHMLDKQFVPSSFISRTGKILIKTRNSYFGGTNFEAYSDIKLESEKKSILDAPKFTQQLPMQHQVKGLVTSRTTSTKEKGLPCHLYSVTGNIDVSADTVYVVGTDMVAAAGKAKLTGISSVIQKPLVLNIQSQTENNGISGLRVIDQTRTESHEICKPSVIIANTIEMSVINGNLTMIAPLLFAKEKLTLSASKGTVYFKAAILNHDISIDEMSLGLSFFGSQAIEAALRNDFKEAALNLLREFPIFASIETLSQSKDIADVVSGSVGTLYHTYQTYKAFAEAENLKDFIKGQIHPNLKLRLGISLYERHWTEAALCWLQARQIHIKAKNVSGEGVMGSCEILNIKAEKDISFVAAAQENRENSISVGGTVGFLPVSVGFDMAASELKAQEYITSRFNVSKLMVLDAGENISLKGICVETLKAIVSAEKLHLETLQDKLRSTNYSFSVSTEGSFSASIGYHNRDFAKEQSGIHALATMLVNIRKDINLIGAKLTLGNEAKPIVAKYPNGEQVSFYEHTRWQNGLTDYFSMSTSESSKCFKNLEKEALAAIDDGDMKSFISLINEIAKLVNANIKVWSFDKTSETLKLIANATISAQSRCVELRFYPVDAISQKHEDLQEGRWSLLDRKSGRVKAERIQAQELVDREDKQQGSVSTGGNLVSVDYQNIEKVRNNNSLISNRIAIEADAAHGFTRDDSQAQVVEVDESCHIAATIPVVDPRNLSTKAKEIQQVLITPPKMFQQSDEEINALKNGLTTRSNNTQTIAPKSGFRMNTDLKIRNDKTKLVANEQNKIGKGNTPANTLDNGNNSTFTWRAHNRTSYPACAEFSDALCESNLAMKAGMKRGVIKLEQGTHQLMLQIGELMGLAQKGSTAKYTVRINEEAHLYSLTPQAQSFAGQCGEAMVDVGLLFLPNGMAYRGAKAILWTASASGMMASLYPTTDGLLSTKVQNGIQATVLNGLTTVGLQYTFSSLKNVKEFWNSKNIAALTNQTKELMEPGSKALIFSSQIKNRFHGNVDHLPHPSLRAEDLQYYKLGPVHSDILNLKSKGDGYFPPYDSNYHARNILLNYEKNFVRVHGNANQAGKWMMRASEIEGLTPLQIKDKFALEFIPEFVSQVNVPGNTIMRASVAGPQLQWGSYGGGLQYELLLNRLPRASYTQATPISSLTTLK